MGNAKVDNDDSLATDWTGNSNKKAYTSTLPGKKVELSEKKVWLQIELQKMLAAAAVDDIDIN